MRSNPIDAQGGQRTVWGGVAFGGGVNAPGTNDWTVTKTGTGTYTIRFSPPFLRGWPSVTTAPAGSGIISIGNASDGRSFNVSTFNAGGAAADQSFWFTAVGR